MQMTIKQAMRQRVLQQGMHVTYQGNRVWKLNRPYPGATHIYVQFDNRGLPFVKLSEDDLIEVESSADA